MRLYYGKNDSIPFQPTQKLKFPNHDKIRKIKLKPTVDVKTETILQ